jgi:glycerol-3-phosphate dehydrogenase (NAD(P)+)
MAKTIKVAVLGSGNMGTAVAQVLAVNGHEVRLWNHEGDREPLKEIEEFGENKKYLPGLRLSKNINPISDIAGALKDARIVFFAVPSRFVESVVKKAAPYLPAIAVCVDVSKGMDEKSLGLITGIIGKNLPPELRQNVVTVSGPTMATDMARGQFTAMNIASKNKSAANLVKHALENQNIKIVFTDDIVGVEVAGSFKNVYAIAMGLCDGLEFSMNTKAALLVQSLKEMGLLIKKMGGKAETLYGLAGLGDLIGTGMAVSSRNRRFGESLVRLKDPKKAAAAAGLIIEGIWASGILCRLGKKYHVKLPFADMVYSVISGKSNPKKEIEKYLSTLK